MARPGRALRGAPAVTIARVAVLSLTLVTAAACGSPPASPAPADAAAIVTALLMPASGTPTSIVVPAGAAQVILRLGGALGDVDQLIVEVTPGANPDEARRWPVDGAPDTGDGARASVTLPAYALPSGDYALTVWEGDAAVVLTYALRVARQGDSPAAAQGTDR